MTDRYDPFMLAGTTFDRFHVERVAGEGGFAVLYQAIDQKLKRPVALKLLTRHLKGRNDAERSRFIDAFLKEAETTVRLSDHPNIATVYDFGIGQTPNRATVPWIAMQWIDGITLEEDLEARRTDGRGGRTLDEAMLLLRPLMAAVAHAHRESFVHRDLKPQNVMLRRSDGHLFLLDFGIAKAIEAGDVAVSGATSARTSGGFSYPYAAPEQMQYRKTDFRTDVYALGLLATELITGRPAYSSPERAYDEALAESPRPTPRKNGVDLGDEIEAVLARAVAVDITRRQSNAGMLARELDEAIAKREARARAMTVKAPAMPGGGVRLNPGQRQALRTALVELFPSARTAGRLADDAGIARERVALDGVMVDVWHDLIVEAERQGKVLELVATAEGEYPHRGLRTLVTAAAGPPPAPPPSPAVDMRQVRPIASPLPPVQRQPAVPLPMQPPVQPDAPAPMPVPDPMAQPLPPRPKLARPRVNIPAPKREPSAAEAPSPPPTPLPSITPEAEPPPPPPSPALLPVPPPPQPPVETSAPANEPSPTPPTDPDPSADTTAKARRRRRNIAIALSGTAIAATAAILIALLWPPTPTPATISKPTPTFPDNMVRIPGGTFTKGRAPYGKPNALDTPAVADVKVAAFAIEPTEVTAPDYLAVMGTSNGAPAGIPMTSVGHDDAARYCQKKYEKLAKGGFAGRLPTEDEWEWAARRGARLYPWEGPYDARCVNTKGPSDSVQPVKSFDCGKTPDGIYDLSGNVWEWTATAAALHPGSTNPTPAPGALTGFFVIRGGSFYNTDKDDLTATARAFERDPSPYVGFRCVFGPID